ncbi:MAG: alpha/beta fold hydrolase [Solirubrobacteraceae bacterium]|nr:alpha/beta fold hydrolase [Solirubrobacteraceae bacterium]
MPADGRLINYHREGSGSPLVLVHGIAATWQCWLPVIPGLAERHDVIAVDLPGFGCSVDLQIPEPSLEHFAQSILDLLDHLGIERFHVSGNSLGGAVALELLKSGRVLSYNGISAAGQTYGPFVNVTKLALRGSYYGSRLIDPIAKLLLRLKPLRAAFLWQMLGKPGRVTADYAYELVHGCAVGSGFESTLKYAIPKRGLDVPAFDGPAQMLWGTRDYILPLSAVGRWAERWDGLKIVPLPGLGHVPMQDEPELIVRAILAWTSAADAAKSAAAA